ncbi:MAG: hypothetical protein GX975_03000 [Clostridiales bacterium]|nr:hypothetical protein [Clostridiales bacterium]
MKRVWIKRIFAALLCMCLLIAMNACGAGKLKAGIKKDEAVEIEEIEESAENKAELELGFKMSSSRPSEPAPDAQEYSNIGIERVAEEDPAYGDMLRMLPALEQYLAYRATFCSEVDAKEASAEDFWTVMAMAIHASPPNGTIDKFGIAHVKRSAVADYALSLFPECDFGEGLPSLKGIYGVSANPGSDIVDMDALGIDTKRELMLFGIDRKIDCYVLRIRVEDAEGSLSMTDWDCMLKYHEDGEKHILPMKIVNAYCINKQN